MKKNLLAFLLAAILSSAIAVEKGDSLAILYYPVYAYTNPDDLSTRYDGIFSFQNKYKLVYIEESEEYAGYFKVKTHDGDTVYVKSNRLSTDQNISRQMIIQEIREGKRNKKYGTFLKLDLPDYPWYYNWIAYFVLLIIAYFFYKKYYKFDRWYSRKACSATSPLYSPWFLKYSLWMGMVIGATEFFSPVEYKWFRAEGFQVWGKYPSNWDYIMWAATVIAIIVGFLALVQPFRRFSFKYAAIYAVIALILTGAYFYIGLITGGLAIAVVLFIGMGKGSSGNSGSSGNQGNQNYSGDTLQTGAFKYIDGERHIKNTGGTYEKY